MFEAATPSPDEPNADRDWLIRCSSDERCGAFLSFAETEMQTRLTILAAGVAVLAAIGSSPAMAQHRCISGYAYRHGVCQPVHPQGYSNPVSGAVSGEASGAARGNAAAGPVGAVVGGALGTAGGAITGTGNMLTGR